MWDNPHPCRFCPVQHAGIFFPDRVPGASEQFVYLAMTKKFLCKGVARAEIPCDPRTCWEGFADVHTRGQLYLAAKSLWQGYYERTFGVSDVSPVFEDLLDELL